LAGLVADAGPELLVFEAEFAAAAQAASHQPPPASMMDADALASAIAASAPVPAAASDPEAPCTLLYTSGTTGRPKGAMVTVKSAFFGAYNNRVMSELSPEAVMLCDAPLFHVIGLIANMHAVLHAGGRLLLSDRFAPGRTLELMGRRAGGVTHYFCVPQMAQALRDDPAYAATDLSRLKALFSGGSPLPPPLVEAFAADGVLALDGYGMTETCGGAFGLPLDAGRLAEKLGSVGVAAPAIEVRLVGPDGRDVATGEVGEIWLRGPSVSPGYWNQPAATAAAFSDGWFRTGDAARVDADGFYTLVDRWKDMYITGGENVYPAEVEAVLAQMPGVADAAVIGVPHPQWGESGCAYVVAAPGVALEPAAVVGFCAERLARYKRPSSVRFIEAVPRTASGKIRKEDLRRRYAAEQGGAGAS
jgi:fatty-acyl-CoA synthase